MRSFGIGTESERDSGSSRDEWRHRGASHTAPPSSTSSQGTEKGRRKRRVVVDEVADGVVGPQPFDFLTKCHGGSCSKRCGRGSKEEDK